MRRDFVLLKSFSSPQASLAEDLWGFRLGLDRDISEPEPDLPVTVYSASSVEDLVRRLGHDQQVVLKKQSAEQQKGNCFLDVSLCLFLCRT